MLSLAPHRNILLKQNTRFTQQHYEPWTSLHRAPEGREDKSHGNELIHCQSRGPSSWEAPGRLQDLQTQVRRGSWTILGIKMPLASPKHFANFLFFIRFANITSGGGITEGKIWFYSAFAFRNRGLDMHETSASQFSVSSPVKEG